MKKNKLSTLLVLCTGLLFPVYAQAQEAFAIGDIETILEENMLNEVSNRYSSVILSFLPEEATRLGYNSVDDKLNTRTIQQNKQTLEALRSVETALNKIDDKKLSAPRKVERLMLQKALLSSIKQEELKAASQNPLFYTQALDSVHDLLVKQLASPLRQKLDLLARLAALPAVADLAEQNLTTADPVLIERGMEKAYYAFLSLNEWNQILLDGVSDKEAKQQIMRITQDAKGASKKLFEVFRQLSQKPTDEDFRLGADEYFQWLNTRYQYQNIKKPILFFRRLDKNLQEAQANLTQALEPFVQPAVETEEITVLDENGQPVTETIFTKKTNDKNTVLPTQVRNAQDFYAAAKTFMKAPIDSEPLETLQNDAQEALNFFVSRGVLPAKDITFNLAQLPQYYTLATPYLFVPPFANQLSPRSDFYLRLPAGNALNQQTLFDQDFNTPTRKLMISGQLVPGRYYQAESTIANSNIRRLFPSKSMINGWEAYAKRLAQTHGYLNTDEDILVLAWDEYLHALAAFTDALLHTQQFSYKRAMDFLTQEHGLEQAKAEAMIRDIAENPGEAVSYLIGLDALEQAYNKYSKKFGKKFDEAEFHSKLFRIGNVPPSSLDKELTRIYKQDKKKK